MLTPQPENRKKEHSSPTLSSNSIHIYTTELLGLIVTYYNVVNMSSQWNDNYKKGKPTSETGARSPQDVAAVWPVTAFS